MPQAQAIERVVDLTDPARNVIYNMSVDEARRLVASGDGAAVRRIDGDFALVATSGVHVRMARSIGRPLRYFIAKRKSGPALIAADRIDAIYGHLQAEGLADQFHPSYTRMVPAHHVTDVALVGCPDPNPTYTRFFDPRRNALPADPDVIGRAYIGALSDEIAKWLQHQAADGPIGVCFSGGIDSGSVLLVAYHAMLRLGMNPSRLKAFTLAVDGGGDDVTQSRRFLDAVGLGLFLEPIEVPRSAVDWREAVRVIEDYKPLDVQCAAMAPGAVPRHSGALPRLAFPARRRRRRREPQGLPHRREPRIDDPQRPQQPDAVSGRLGRGRDQALADLLRRPQPRLRPHLRPRRGLRL